MSPSSSDHSHRTCRRRSLPSTLCATAEVPLQGGPLPSYCFYQDSFDVVFHSLPGEQGRGMKLTKIVPPESPLEAATTVVTKARAAIELGLFPMYRQRAGTWLRQRRSVAMNQESKVLAESQSLFPVVLTTCSPEDTRARPRLAVETDSQLYLHRKITLSGRRSRGILT